MLRRLICFVLVLCLLPIFNAAGITTQRIPS